ncbi:betaine-aldehyde dehydrogenase [Halopenitus malekzadehii]|uniref:Betaine-aldehyde dehydrogenase n=1 Tax=Halopenitus malekzadehii TaxID=1267564 RepID=A0A1H6JU40_9EURY|nr:aldehyde dehydrogenase family protein [Halopenitus malekzadehii]SEH64105.1 betaine-aldehyde dehydrogenase [Halopenitus malekzadehii]
MREVNFESAAGRNIELSVVEKMYIDGSFVESDSVFEATSPSTGDTLGEIPNASTDQVDMAVTAAQRASDEWKEWSVWERRDALEKFATVFEDAATELTNLDVADNGSSIAKMKDDAEKGAMALRFFAGLGTEMKGETVPVSPDTLDYTLREPYGVVGGIIPFNHPAAFVARKIGPAVMAGNGIVIKPSEHTSLSALYVGHLIDEVDVFPDGLINIVTGGPEVGEHLVKHRNVRMITLIGSPNTGKAVMRGAAENVSNVMLELGGKNPNIVFPDVDPATAADGAVDGMSLTWQGQSCGSGSRLLVHDDVYDEVVDGVVRRFGSLNVGDPFDPETEMAAIVSEPQFEKVRSYVETAKEEGAELLTGGSVIEEFEDGYFFEPTVFAVEPQMTIAQEEIFGPVLSVLSWNDYDDMIEVANDVDYGLTASVWTNDLRTAHRTVKKLEAGYIWVNQHGSHYLGAPFGGFKESGNGKNESIEELLEHTREKNVNIMMDGELDY